MIVTSDWKTHLHWNDTVPFHFRVEGEVLAFTIISRHEYIKIV